MIFAKCDELLRWSHNELLSIWFQWVPLESTEYLSQQPWCWLHDMGMLVLHEKDYLPGGIQCWETMYKVSENIRNINGWMGTCGSDEIDVQLAWERNHSPRVRVDRASFVAASRNIWWRHGKSSALLALCTAAGHLQIPLTKCIIQYFCVFLVYSLLRTINAAVYNDGPFYQWLTVSHELSKCDITRGLID